MSSASPPPLPESVSKMSSKDETKSEERSRSPEARSEKSESETSEREKPTETSASPDAQPEAGPSTSASPAPPVVSNAHVQGDWQAIWSPQHNAYYFFNSRTNETTWTNPLADTSSSNAAGSSTSTSGAGPSSSRAAIEAAALAAGIDPELAFLDPTLLAGPSAPAAFTYTAKFNARTGAFAKPDARNPEHVSEYERMKRMSSFYFDMDAWQQDVEKRNEEEAEAGKKRKKPTKKDLESFKERKKQKKLAKTAWLRS